MKVAVLGVGTAGVISVGHLLSFMPNDTEVYSIHDPAVPMLGIGESTTVQIPYTLWHSAGFTLLKDSHELDATIKHGIKYVGWREQDFHSLILPPAHALHFNNFKLKDFCFGRFTERWGSKFSEIQAKITGLENGTDCAIVHTDTEKLKFDWVIDCRGYPEDYTDYTMAQDLPINHCLVHTINQPGDWTWTYHTAHRNGWMFGIPLQTRQGWGYLYNDEITERSDAVSDLAERFKVNENSLNLREFSFKPYYANKFIDGRICVNGNRALFFEPMEALSGWFYDRVIRSFYNVAINNEDPDEYNQDLLELAEDYQNFICYVYHGGSTYSSDFWRTTSRKATTRLLGNQRFQKVVSKINSLLADQNRSADQLTRVDYVAGVFSLTGWAHLDKNLGYGYFTGAQT